MSRGSSSRCHELALPEAPGAAHRGRWAGIPELAAGVGPGPPADGKRDGGGYRERPAAEPEQGTCIRCGKPSAYGKRLIFARAY